MNDPFIKIENLNFSYTDDEGNDAEVLHNLNLEIRRGELVAILGHNGSGKSTLAKLLNLILTPQSGKITIDGLEITKPDLTEDELFENRRKVGMVFQNPDNQLVATIVDEDVAFGPRSSARRDTQACRRRAENGRNDRVRSSLAASALGRPEAAGRYRRNNRDDARVHDL